MRTPTPITFQQEQPQEHGQRPSLSQGFAEAEGQGSRTLPHLGKPECDPHQSAWLAKHAHHLQSSEVKSFQSKADDYQSRQAPSA